MKKEKRLLEGDVYWARTDQFQGAALKGRGFGVAVEGGSIGVRVGGERCQTYALTAPRTPNGNDYKAGRRQHFVRLTPGQMLVGPALMRMMVGTQATRHSPLALDTYGQMPHIHRWALMV